MFGLGLTPWLLLGTSLGLALAAGGGYYEGGKVAGTRYQLEISQMQAAAQGQVEKTREALQAQAQEAVATALASKAKTQVVYRTNTQYVDKIIDRPVYQSVCFDSDGLLLANAAISNRAGTGATAAGAAASMSTATGAH